VKKYLAGLSVIVASVLFFGCGGGGESSASTSGIPSIVNAIEADPTLENGEVIVDMYVGPSTSNILTGVVSTANSTGRFGVLNLQRSLLQQLSSFAVPEHSSNSRAGAAIESYSEACIGGGTIEYKDIDLSSDKTTMSITTESNNCIDETGVMTTGKLNYQITGYNLGTSSSVLTQGTMIVSSRTTMSRFGQQIVMYEGSSRFVEFNDATGNDTNLTTNLTYTFNGKSYANMNFKSHQVEANTTTTETFYSGKVYFGLEKNQPRFFEVNTSYNHGLTPIVWHENDENRSIYTSGTMKFNGSSNQGLTINITPDNNFTVTVDSSGASRSRILSPSF